jgi:multiple sugar transport system ATP-binding protein
MGTVKIVDLKKVYDKNVVAVEKANLEIAEGEFLVLLGPSGCGKTTIMRMIAGLEEVTEGKVYLDGKDITNLNPRHRNIGMVFQRYAMWPHMTIRENIAFPLKLKKYPKKKINDIIARVAKMTEIEPYLDRHISQLSGGQCQRAAVARAVAYEPKIFLMDEPLSALDAKLRESMRTDLKVIQRKSGTTTIFVTHDQAEALSLADRIVVMKMGEIMQIGTPDEVYNDCENMFIADFIGTPPTNFFDVKIKANEDSCTIINKEFKFEYTGKHLNGLKKYDDKDVVLGIRPEDMTLAADIEKSFISLKCGVVEPQGSYKVVVLYINDKKVKMVITGDRHVTQGELIHVGYKKNKIMLFDKETESRIR